MSAENLDSADLKGVSFNGLINEDVMQRIWDISNIPLPFSDSINSDGVGNSYAEWTTDELGQPDVDNATVDGADAGPDQSTTGERVGNHCQYPDRVVRVSKRAQNSNTIGFTNTLAYQVMKNQRLLRRDVEAIALQGQASVADNGDTIAGRMGGFPSWLVTSTNRGVGGVDGGFTGGSVAAPTPGDARPLSETTVRDIAQSVWEQGGNPTKLHSTASAIRRLSEYMFTSSARIATLQRNEQGSNAAMAIGSVNVFLTDFGVTLEFVPNRLMQTYLSGDTVPQPVSNVLIYDPEMVMFGILQGYRVDELDRKGQADNRQMIVDLTLKVLNEKAHGLIADVDHTVPAVA